MLLITFAGCGKGLEPDVKEGCFDFSVTYEELGEWWSEDVSVLESYGVRIISYEYEAPIENIYK